MERKKITNLLLFKTVAIGRPPHSADLLVSLGLSMLQHLLITAHSFEKRGNHLFVKDTYLTIWTRHFVSSGSGVVRHLKVHETPGIFEHFRQFTSRRCDECIFAKGHVSNTCEVFMSYFLFFKLFFGL